MSRRGKSFDWRSAPDEDDAAGASRDIELWMAERGRERDWEGVLGRLRDALVGITRSPEVQGDGRCREILSGLVEAADMAAVDSAMTALRERVEAMRGTAAPPRADDALPSARRTFRL